MATMFPLILAFTLAESLGDSMLADSDVANESETELIPRCWTPDTLTGNYSAAHAPFGGAAFQLPAMPCVGPKKLAHVPGNLGRVTPAQHSRSPTILAVNSLHLGSLK